MSATQDTETRTGFVAIVGRPNAGKSTLLNALLGTKLAIVSHRPQTTRNRLRGVVTRGNFQTILVDTPGIHRGGGELNRFMVNETIAELSGVDAIVLVSEVTRTTASRPPSTRHARGDLPAATVHIELHEQDQYVLEQLKHHASGTLLDRLVVAVNKIDLLPDKARLLPLLSVWRDAGWQRLVPVSALRADGLDRLMREIEPLLPLGPHHYPADTLTDRTERFLAAELIREQVFLRCRQELPHATAVEIESYEARGEKNDVRISARIHVEREAQKAIIIGRGGQMIKSIGVAAREEIAGMIGCPVHLQLEVHLEPNWTRSPRARRRFGYE